MTSNWFKKQELKSFQMVVQELADKYGIPYEIVESILIDWFSIEYYAATGKEPHESDRLSSL